MRVLCPGSPAVVSSESSIDFPAVRRQALSVVAGQAAVAVCGAVICYAAVDARSSLSALIGGGIGAAATLVQVSFGLRNSAGKDPRAVVRGFYRGSAMKLLVTVALFVLALRHRNLAPAPLFVTYVATFLVYWLTLARTFRARVQSGASAGMEDKDR